MPSNFVARLTHDMYNEEEDRKMNLIFSWELLYIGCDFVVGRKLSKIGRGRLCRKGWIPEREALREEKH